MTVRAIAPEAWAGELESFSRQHEGWLVSITIRWPDGHTAVVATGVPLRGVGPAAHSRDELVITVGGPRDHLTHEIRAVTAVRLEQTPDRADRALLVEADDGTTTTVQFRSPIRSEQVDGLPVPADE